MRDRPHRRWPFWQVSRTDLIGWSAARPAGRLGGAEVASFGCTVNEPTPPPTDPLAELKADPPGPDGIRRRLVERVRELIAAGAYDTPDRWLAAEERLFDRIGGSAGR